MFQLDRLFAVYSTVNIFQVSQVEFHMVNHVELIIKNVVDRLCTFPLDQYLWPNIGSRPEYNIKKIYSRWGLTYILFKKLNKSAEKS